MAVNATQLLRQLEPAVRPGAVSIPSKLASAFESQSFDQLLSLASRGAIASGRQIEVACEAQPPIEASQLERLAAAADSAEAAGARRALIMIDQRSFVLDVQTRSLVSELRASSTAGVINVDAAMHVSDGDDAPGMRLQPPGNGIIPPIAAKQLPYSAKPQTAEL